MVEKTSFLFSLFNNLGSAKIDYFVLGSYHGLPNDSGDSDIDIVVREENISKIEYIFQELSDSFNVILASYYENYNTKFFRFLGKDWGVQIDVFYKGLCYMGCQYYPIENLKPYVITHNNIVRALDWRKGFFVDFFKEIIHNGKAKEKYIKSVLESYSVDRGQCEQEVREIYGEKTAELIGRHLTVEGLKQISKSLQKELQRVVLAGRFGRIVSFRVKNALRLLQKRPGYVLVVEGTDGSGKSTIINHITPILNECFHDSIIYRHLRPHAIPDIGVLLGKKKAVKEGTVCPDPHSKKSSGLLGSILRWLYYMIDYTIGYLKVVWPQIHTKSKVFIFDRYYYDYYIDQRRSRTNLPHWVLRLGESFVPKPDLILCLGGDPQKIYARKPETSLEEVERQTKTLLKFCNNRKAAKWIDTTLPLEDSCVASMNAIYETMSNRFKI